LRVKGFGVALDGFGTGRAPADQLRRLPLTEVELAPFLVTGAHADPSRARVLEETVEVARALDVTVVGDGCESEDDLRLLLTLGCDRVMGGFVADAMPAEELTAWAAQWDPDRLGIGRRE
jgi:EAL domain-containing protein (putative c-di-GMP-specific phosphodiesterase class I)